MAAPAVMKVGSRKRLSEYSADQLAYIRGQDLTVRCAACAWEFVGTAGAGIVAHRAHRTAEHPELSARSNPHKPVATAATKVADRARLIATLRERGPLTASQLSEATGVPGGAVGPLLSWAARSGGVEVRRVRRHWLLDGQEVPPVVRSSRCEGHQTRIRAALQDGPLSSEALGPTTGLKPRGVSVQCGKMQDVVRLPDQRWCLLSQAPPPPPPPPPDPNACDVCGKVHRLGSRGKIVTHEAWAARGAKISASRRARSALST